MMADAAVLSVISQCFTQVDRDTWNQLTGGPIWTDFVDTVRDLTQTGRTLGDVKRPIERLRRARPLQDALSEREVEALFVPPTYEEKRSFASRHFTGGLPESALPVESLYRDWRGGLRGSVVFSRAKSYYLADTARYMAAMIEAAGGSVPPQFSACPDHLSLELDLAAVLLRSSAVDKARALVVERLTWLTAYRMKLLSLKDDASFYIALIDVLIAIREQLAGESDTADQPPASGAATGGTYQRGKGNVG